jgi:hypothetical protein
MTKHFEKKMQIGKANLQPTVVKQHQQSTREIALIKKPSVETEGL